MSMLQADKASRTARKTVYPDGTGLPILNGLTMWSDINFTAIYMEFENDRGQDINYRYIHSVTTQSDNTHVIDAISGTVIGRVWSNLSTGAFVLVWSIIFDAIETIAGKKLNFQIFSSKSNLLGVIGDSEGAQAQGLEDVIILRRKNLPAVGDRRSLNFDVYMENPHRSFESVEVFGLKSHIGDADLQDLLGYLYLITNFPDKIQLTGGHSYPWLLPSLNREISCMDKRYFDLTPRDTHPIEGNHVKDNQARAKEKQQESEKLTGRDTKKFHTELKAEQQQAK
ncbi:hypothetical protein C8J57DRAFT_1243515 [Mycena rebaudengoi]|nr:hypothetical protein C8J57DRAFT_1243515 [Mycena rebaudengoi]